MTGGSIAVLGGGITGLAAAEHLTGQLGVPAENVVVFEASNTLGGRIRASPFAGVAAIDEGADAFLARVPEALELAARVGLTVALTHPEPVHAAIWHGDLHRIPEGLLLGVPGQLGPLARTRLLSWRGKIRAAAEPLVPRTSLAPDSIGAFVRARFGNEVHERLVDALVGSIYATDTDRFSLAEVPQLHSLASRHRSLLLGSRSAPRTPQAGAANSGAIFAAPTGGVAQLTSAVAQHVSDRGASIRIGTPIDEIVAAGAPTPGWLVDGERFDAVVCATPPAATAKMLATAAPAAAELLAGSESADVILVTLHIPATEWPERLAGLSGYLVPKPVQRWVTAASFGTQKWAHWQPPSGGQILRVSIGRDARPVLHLSDDEVITHVLADLARHLGVEFSPLEIRISRWPGAFAQYRPHHVRWVDAVEQALPAGLFVAGAGYRGIGIPACIRQGTTIGQRAVNHLRSLPQ